MDNINLDLISDVKVDNSFIFSLTNIINSNIFFKVRIENKDNNNNPPFFFLDKYGIKDAVKIRKNKNPQRRDVVIKILSSIII